MHCGHAFMTYKNWETARLTAGDFILIFDDETTNMSRTDRQGFPIEVAGERWMEDMEWLGMRPDRVAFSREFAGERAEAYTKLGVRLPVCIGKNTGIERWIPIPYPHMGGHPWYSPALVVGRVVDDHCLGVNGFWRGMDLRCEEQLYDYLGHQLGYPQVAQGYLPTVGWEPNKKCSQSTQDVRAVTIRALRKAGYEPWQIISTLLESELRSAAAGLSQVLIPSNCLTLDKVKWLKFVGDPTYNEAILKEAEGKPWEDTAREWVREQRDGLESWWPLIR